jgi:hypothetical protein
MREAGPLCDGSQRRHELELQPSLRELRLVPEAAVGEGTLPQA